MPYTKKEWQRMARKCQECYFFLPDPEPTTGECRRRAPNLTFKTTTKIWPSVSINDFCGEGAIKI